MRYKKNTLSYPPCSPLGGANSKICRSRQDLMCFTLGVPNLALDPTFKATHGMWLLSDASGGSFNTLRTPSLVALGSATGDPVGSTQGHYEGSAARSTPGTFCSSQLAMAEPSSTSRKLLGSQATSPATCARTTNGIEPLPAYCHLAPAFVHAAPPAGGAFPPAGGAFPLWAFAEDLPN